MRCVRRHLFISKLSIKYLSEYYSFVKAKWEELNLYHPYPTDVETWKKQREELKVVSFLSGLNSHYASLKDHSLAGNDLPS